MVEFMCITQMDSMTNFMAPSSAKYESHKDIPFVVKNKDDIAFFESKPNRFRRMGVMDVPPPPESRLTDDKILEIKLIKIRGIGQKTARKVTDIYINANNLKDVVTMGEDIDPNIPENQAKLIVEYIKDGGFD